jgi:aryl-alcohol dehydrogenase-like predicted oxidoreductase
MMKKDKTKQGRRDFIKTGLAGIAGAAVAPSLLRAGEEEKKKERKLINRTLGKTGLKCPIVSIGAAGQDPALYRAALDMGLTHFDTANSYGNGNHEVLVGEVIKGRPRDSYIITTKVHLPMDQRTGHFIPGGATTEAFISAFETSLGRLGIEYVDILHMHALSSGAAVTYEPLVLALEKMKKEGKTRFVGVSVHTNEPEVIDAAVDSKFHEVVLTSYNFRQPHVNEVKKSIARAAKAGLGIVAMKTQAGVYWDQERQKKINMTAALKWVLRDENVHTSIPGFSSLEQLEEDMAAMEDLKFSDQEKKDLELGMLDGMHGLYCAQCRRCVDTCRHHIEIPTMMRSFMYAYGYRNLAKAKDTIRPLLAEAGKCRECGACTVDCTMGFDVKGKITDIARLENVPDDFLV